MNNSGFALGQEELLAALLIGSISLPVGFDNLESRVFNGLDEACKLPLMAAAERSLLAHQFLIADEELLLEESVKMVLQTCAKPDFTWIMLHQPSTQAERASYFHQAGDDFLAHIEIAGIHQFIRLSEKKEIVDTAIQLVSPISSSVTDSMSGHLAESYFADLVNSLSRPTSKDLREQLKKAGFDKASAHAFAATFDQLTSITAFAHLSHTPQLKIERAFTIVRGENAQWLLNLTAPDTLYVQGLSQEAAKRILQELAG